MIFFVYFYKKNMQVNKDISLKKFNTFGFDYKADRMINIFSEEEAVLFFKNKNQDIKNILIIGGGSNILFTGDFKGTLIHPEFGGIQTEAKYEDSVVVSSGAGVIWDNLVDWSVKNGFGGLENLSLIPGCTGAAPVQNIGAYGTEVKDTIEKVRAVSTEDGSVEEFNNKECCFGYRSSFFKGENRGKYMVTRVYYRLSTNYLPKLDYGSLNDEIKSLGKPTISKVRQAVINIRRRKLPDPEVTGNAGSFFKNPVISISSAKKMRETYPEMPVYNDQSGGIKLAAGWLIDRCGWKGKRIGDAGVHDKQALVLVNYGRASGKNIYDLSEAIRKSVQDKFGVCLEREVEVVGTI
jgi:UDP-N-acetylmuramate dehydrogenase